MIAAVSGDVDSYGFMRATSSNNLIAAQSASTNKDTRCYPGARALVHRQTYSLVKQRAAMALIQSPSATIQYKAVISQVNRLTA